MQRILFLYIALIILVRPAIPAFVYILNYDYISNVLCENKDKPKEHCNGKCFLEKNIQKDVQENNKTNSNAKSIEIVDFIAIYTEHKNKYAITYLADINIEQNYPCKSENYSFNYIAELFHPPTLI